MPVLDNMYTTKSHQAAHVNSKVLYSEHDFIVNTQNCSLGSSGDTFMQAAVEL